MDAPIRAAAELGRLQRGLGLFGLGALSAVAATLIADGAARATARPGPVAVWVADREAHEVVGLDADLLRAVAVDLSWPVEVEACRDGGAWIAHSLTGGPFGGHRLVRITPEGRVVLEVESGPIADLDVLGDDAIVLERPRHRGDAGRPIGGAARVLRVDAAGDVVVLDLDGDACVAACADGRLALGSEHGRVRLHELDAAPGTAPPPVAAAFDGPVLDLVPGPERATWWALIGGDERGPVEGGTARLCLLEPDLTPRWSVAVPGSPRRVAALPGEAAAWLPATRGSRAVLVRDGRVELVAAQLGLAGLERATAWRAGVLIAAPGALLRRDGRGGPRPGQGGFAWVADLSPVPRRASARP